MGNIGCADKPNHASKMLIRHINKYLLVVNMIQGSSKNGVSRNFITLLLVLVLLLILILVIELDQINIARFATLSRNECPIPARLHVSGEPELYSKWNADAYLLSGGLNLFPGKAAFHPLLIGDCCQNGIFERGLNQTLRFKPITNRTFADVVYRSSYCQDRRDDLVAIVRQKVESAGFTFKATGLCGGTGYPQKLNFTGRGRWQGCGPECTDSKIMLSFERFQLGHDYLSEKLFLPLEYGAVPAYFGNGHRILDLLSVNRKAFIDRIEFQSDEAFAERIVNLLRNPEELQRMQEEPAFHNVEMARKRIMFLHPIGKYGEEGNPELYHALRENEKFKRFINGTNIKIRSSGVDFTRLLQHVLNISSFQKVHGSRTCIDIEVHGCCLRRR